MYIMRRLTTTATTRCFSSSSASSSIPLPLHAVVATPPPPPPLPINNLQQQQQPHTIHIVIEGDPQPLRRHRTGRMGTYNPSANDQRKFLELARPFLPPRPLVGPLEATLVFRMCRPRSHYRSGRYAHLLKENVPRFHTARTDLDNLVKLVLDSINEVAYEDDRQVVSVKAVKEYCNRGVGSTELTLRVLCDEGEEEKEEEKEEAASGQELL